VDGLGARRLVAEAVGGGGGQARCGRDERPCECPGGVYILKLLGRREGRQFSFAHVASEISHELTSRRRSASLAAWVRQSRAQADVEIIK